jgi:hypothetical protein
MQPAAAVKALWWEAMQGSYGMIHTPPRVGGAGRARTSEQRSPHAE